MQKTRKNSQKVVKTHKIERNFQVPWVNMTNVQGTQQIFKILSKSPRMFG